MRFYHGTCKSKADQILTEGLEPGFLTLCLEQANYYADCAAEESDCDPIVLVVDADESQLSVDFPSLEEPLTYITRRLEMTEDELHEALGEDGWPEDHDWKHGLSITLSVHTGFVPASCVQVHSGEDLPEPEWLTPPEEIFQ